ncbi:50S ribosomal protein L13 [Buchnera aphidicola (Ceratoglyphina bambusae)]|uniref:50S ribosomal protein L13 n=1 Tax=Buchnera aphidicola TaxID=9 RepID=UPI0031B86E93
MKSFLKKKKNESNWFYIDASGKILGRLASSISKYLMGKHKSNYVNNIDNGDYIIVLNAEKICVTGNKKRNKIYFNHTGYVGGLKKNSFNDLLKKCPEKIIKIAVKGMLPKNSLGRNIIKKLKVYSGNVLKHLPQKPKLLKI